MQPESYEFGPFTLDWQGDVLAREGVALEAGHRAVLLLRALLRAQGQVVTKAELTDAAWPGAVVEESNLPARVHRLAAQGDKPRIVVLPLANLGGRPGRNSSFAFKGRMIGSQQVAQELDVRYVLEGSVRQGLQQVRITAQLIDAATAHQIWGERFDLGFDDLRGAQDTIAQRVAGAIEPELLRSESARAASRNTAGSPTVVTQAWDLVHRGAWHFHQVHRAGHHQARELFRQACAVEPGLAPAHLWLARVSAGLAAYGWTDQEAADLHEGIQAASAAIHRDETNVYTHYALAIVSVFAGAFEQAIRAAERAVELNPSFALGQLVLGMARLFSGDVQGAVAALEQGLAINPADPQNFVWFNTQARALLFAGQPRAAADAAERALKVRPDWRAALETAVCCAAARPPRRRRPDAHTGGSGLHSSACSGGGRPRRCTPCTRARRRSTLRALIRRTARCGYMTVDQGSCAAASACPSHPGCNQPAWSSD